MLLELLWSMRMLERDGADDGIRRYRCTATTLQYFCRNAVTFCGDAWLSRLHALRLPHLDGGPGRPAIPLACVQMLIERA